MGDSLLRRFLFAEVDRMGLVARRCERTAEMVLADPGDGFVFDTAAVLLQPPATIDVAAAVDAARRFFPAGRTWCLYSLWPTADLRPLGLELVGHPPFMYRPAGGADPPPPAGLRVAEVTTAAELEAYSRVVVDGYPLEEGGSVAGPEVLGSSYRFWLGWEGERAVAAAAAHVVHGLVDVTWVATRPEARGRGYGRALSWAATRADPDLPAALIASDPGRPVYERLGYSSVMRLTLWWCPAWNPPPAQGGRT